jgi:hypothetical protein
MSPYNVASITLKSDRIMKSRNAIPLLFLLKRREHGAATFPKNLELLVESRLDFRE